MFPLPAVPDAPRVCFQIMVPNEPTHLSNFFGAIQLLTRWYSYIESDTQPSKPAADTWRDILLSLYPQTCTTELPIPIAEWIDEMTLCENLRFHNGVLQALCCGEWTDIPGQPIGGIGGSGQPGGGSPTPPPGGCTTYHAVVVGSDIWQSPAVVNTGDTIQISNASGAWSDGAGLFYCPDGRVFFAGNCTVPALDALDPLPSQNHMALLSKIAGVFTNVSGGGVITVPAGVVNALLLFQANDHTLADNGGQITFDITVCNMQMATWSHTFDFTLSPNGFVPYIAGATNIGHWVAGIGWEPNDYVNGTAEWYRTIALHLTGLTAFQVTRLEAVFNYTLGHLAGSYAVQQSALLESYDGVTPVQAFNYLLGSPVPNGSNDISTNVTGTGQTQIIVNLTTDYDPGSNAGFTGASILQSITVSGRGPEPVWP